MQAPVVPLPPIQLSRHNVTHKFLQCLALVSKAKTTYPIVTSKILLPTELETAISPNPLRATSTDVIKSGMDVPAARKVKPIISLGMLFVMWKVKVTNIIRPKMKKNEYFEHILAINGQVNT